MSSLSLPPDPYKALGVAKDAKLPAIRSAHRKLVLQCHPDKVQDAALKAIKQDEFQKVQQAYEILSDDTKRLQYDEQLKLFELRKEMGRGVPTARSNPFEYEVKTAEPRPNSYETRSPPYPSYPRPTPNRSHEDIMYEDNRQYHTFKKSTSYESTTDRKRSSDKTDARYHAELLQQRRREEEEKAARAREKESKRAHGEKKKSRDKEKRKGTEEKRGRTSGPFVEELSEEEYFPRVPEKKSGRQLAEEDLRRREEDARQQQQQRMAEESRRRDDDRRRDFERQQRLAEDSNRERERERAREQERLFKAKMADEQARKNQVLMTEKARDYEEKARNHENYREQYIEAARLKAEAEKVHPGPLRREKTYTAQSYNVRNMEPLDFSEDDSPPKRSSATRRASETTRESSKSRKSPSSKVAKEAFFAEPASVPRRKPALQSQNSAPPVLTKERKEPSRSKTEDNYSRQPAPSLSRASTFANDGYPRDREVRSSGLKKAHAVYSDDDDDYHRSLPRQSSNPPPRASETRTRYGIGEDNKVERKQPEIYRHRSELDTLNEENYSTRRRDESPHGKPSRPGLPRNLPSSETRPRASPSTSSYHHPLPKDYAKDSYASDYADDQQYNAYSSQSSYAPQIITATHRPPIVREVSSRSSQYPSPNIKVAAPHNIIYAKPHYDPPRRDIRSSLRT